MVYKLYCDNNLLYHSNIENLKIFNASVELELNKTGSFDFELQQDHPYYSRVEQMKSILRLYQDDYLLFRGRVLDEEIGWRNERKLHCEGDLAFLLDSKQRPFTFTGTPAEVLAYVLSLHNAQVDEEKQFQPGNVTVEGRLTVTREDYPTTKETLEKALIEPLGGYLITRYENGVAYLDYLSEITLLSPQKITFGKNLLDLKRFRKGADIVTALIPLGAKLKDAEGNDTGKRLTIESVNGGADYVQDEEAIAQHGVIVDKVFFDDITDAATLKATGEADLAQRVNRWESIELSAADLAMVGQDVASFHLATQVEVESVPHGLKQRFIVSKLKINLHKSTENKLTLGGVLETFTAQASKTPTTASSGKDGRDGQDAVTLRIDSSRGTVFKNSEVSTVLSAVIFKGGKTITDAATMRAEFGNNAYLEWLWQRMGEETFGTILATDSRISNEGFSLSLSPSDVDTKVVFKCQLITD